MTFASGLGQSALPFSEIMLAASWLDDRERKIIRDMSKAYLNGLSIGEDRFGIPPWNGD